MKAGQSAYRERKRKKRTYRSLWIIRINAALKPHNLSYSKFIYALKLNGVEMNRKALSELAIRNPDDFTSLVELAKVKS
jgi:large subunit ribosomal protein L20